MSDDSYLIILIDYAGPDEPSDSDHGYGEDDANTDEFFVDITASESVTIIESGSLQFSGSDSGEGNDSGSLTFAGSDSGIGSDSGSFVIKASDNSIVVVEVGVVSGVTYTDSDIGTGSEEGSAVDYNTLLPYGILDVKWYGAVDTKWSTITSNRWRSRLVTNGDQIS